MALVALPFQPRWRAAVLEGSKTTSVRTKRYGQRGDEFVVEGARFVLVDVRQRALRDARDDVWREEGMASPDEFERVWAENHPARGFRADDAVWQHTFKRAD